MRGTEFAGGPSTREHRAMSIDIELQGRTALVTGSGQGIGLAIASRLAEAGASVVLNARSRASVDRATQEVETALPGSSVRGVAADLATDDGVQSLLTAVPEVDVLVNNLGIFGAAEPLQIEAEEWRRYFEVNVLAGIRLTQAYLPGMMARGWGRVQYIGSDSAVVTPAEMIQYGMSKTALLGVSRGFAKTAAGTGVTVNSVLAGPTHTGGVEDFVYSLVDSELPWEAAQQEFMKTHRPQSLVQRLIEPEEIANMVVYLSSPLASATTGAAVRVDGGYIDAILP